MRLLRILSGLLVLLTLLPGTAYAARASSHERPRSSAPHAKGKKGAKKPHAKANGKADAKPHAKARKPPRAARKKNG